MSHEFEKKVDGLSKWLKSNLPQFDWLLRQKTNMEYYFQKQATMEKEIERLEKRLDDLEWKMGLD